MQKVILFGNLPSWIFKGASVDLDFANNRSFGCGNSFVNCLTVARSTSPTSVNVFASDSSGNAIPFGQNTLRITNQGLLVEESRTNLILQSQAFATSPWADTSNGVGTGTATATNNTVVAPDGTLTGSTLALSVRSANTRLQQISQNTPSVGAVLYASSIYTKATTAGDIGKVVNLWQGNGSTAINVASITLSSGWQRFTTPPSTIEVPGSQSLLIIGRLSVALGGPNDLTAVSFDIWGGQAETASFDTSYIPTTTVAIQRNADNISLTGLAASTLAASRGSVVEWSTAGQATRAGTLLDSNGSIMLGETAANALTTAISAGLTTGNTATWTGVVGSGLSWDTSGRNLVLNNGTAATDTQATTPTSTFHIGSTSGSSAFIDAYIRRLGIFNSKLNATTLGLDTIAQ